MLQRSDLDPGQNGMEFRQIGNTDLHASVLGLGCNNLGWRTDTKTSHAIVHAAVDLGINFFDTADVYGRRGGSETLLGSALRGKRVDVLIATKFGAAMSRDAPQGQASSRYVIAAAEASLKRLQTDYIDLFQMHWHDPTAPIGETLLALAHLRHSGKIRAAGCCNLSMEQFVAAERCATELGLAPFVSIQASYSLIERDIEDDLLPCLREGQTSLIPYFPLAGGLLSGKYAVGSNASRGRLDDFQPHRDRFLTDQRLQQLNRLTDEAEQKGQSLLAHALGWLRAQPKVATIIAGASSPDQVAANIAAILSA